MLTHEHAIVNLHVVENIKTVLTGLTEKQEGAILEISHMFCTSSQNNFKNICYLGYSTVTSALRLFADVRKFSQMQNTTVHL